MVVLRSAQHPQIPRFWQIFRGTWPMPLSLVNHSALALFAQCTRVPTSAHSIGVCVIWVCISSSSSSSSIRLEKKFALPARQLVQKICEGTCGYIGRLFRFSPVAPWVVRLVAESRGNRGLHGFVPGIPSNTGIPCKVVMGANRGASRLSPSLACATGITNAYVKCAG